MTCPHCSQSINRRQRANLVCDLCKKEFAFEPKTHPLGLHDLRFRRAVERLGAGGTKYTARQLHFALRRKPAPQASPWVAVAFLFVGGVVVIVLTGLSPAAAFAGKVIGGITLLLGVITLLAVVFGRPKAEMTAAEFQASTLDRWRAIYGALPAGLVDETALAGLPEEERPRQGLAGVVVCPEREVLMSLLANGVPRQMRLGLLGTAPPVDAWEKDLLELLRNDPRLPIYLLHDASAEGAFLARDLPQLLGLKPKHRIFDLGLNPKKSIEKKRLTVVRPVPEELVARLDREAVGADVAGARPIRRGRAQVSPEETAWLKAGNCAPILAVPPASLIKRLRFALDKVAARPRPPAAKAEPGADAAAALGFMSEPA